MNENAAEFNPLVSITANAAAQPSRTMPAKEIPHWLRTGSHGPLVAKIRKTFAKVLADTGDAKAAKKAVDADKKNLAGIMSSGFFTARGDKNLKTYSQILCGDVDGLATDQIGVVYDKIASDPHCLFVSVSPTASGVKFFCRTTGDASQHERSVAAMAKHFRDTYGIELDPACKNVERLCFAPDNASEWNGDAVPFDPLPVELKAERVKSQSAIVAGSTREQIAEKLLGEIQDGICKCPGQHLHTSANGAKDCKVMLDGVPTIKCFHNSCAGIVAGVNHELRSQIGRAEFVPQRTFSHLAVAPPDAGRDDAPPPTIADEYFDREAADDLPPIINADDFISEPIEPPAELIEGILHKGSKLAFGGSSKSFKTWSLLDVAISVAAGKEWLGRATAQGKVLFVNFEIQKYAWQGRLLSVKKAKGVAGKIGLLEVWNLRGHAAGFKRLIPKIIARCRAENFALIILDPIYKLYGNTDENSAGNVALLLNELERLATETGAAIAFGAHFAKGNAAGKEAIDRISGSGVFARDPDSLLIFTKHETDDAFTVEPILRNFAPVAPFAVRWQFPLMQLADDLDPAKLKQASGRKRQHDPAKLLALITNNDEANPISVSEWARLAEMPRKTLADYMAEMRSKKWIQTIGDGYTAKQAITNEGKAFISK